MAQFLAFIGGPIGVTLALGCTLAVGVTVYLSSQYNTYAVIGRKIDEGAFSPYELGVQIQKALEEGDLTPEQASQLELKLKPSR